MSLLIVPSITKVQPGDVERFMNEQRDTAHKFAKTNPKREADKKIALDMYAALSKPIDSYLDSIVTSTGLKLRDVIDNYWFKTPQGLYVTTHYESFTWLIGNRKVKAKHVAELINKIRKEGYAFTIETVNERGEIIEGQHGLVAVSYLRAKDNQTHPYIFHLQPEANVQEVEQLNSGRSEWSAEDTLYSGTSLKIPTYVKLSELFYERYKGRFAPSNLLDIAIRGSVSAKDDFEKKRLMLNEYQIHNTIKFLDKVVELYDTIYPGREDKKISNAWSTILLKLHDVPNFSFKRLLQLINEGENPAPAILSLRKLTSQNKEFICEYLVSIYNFNRQRQGSNYIDVKNWQDLKERNTTLADLDRIMDHVK